MWGDNNKSNNNYYYFHMVVKGTMSNRSWIRSSCTDSSFHCEP